MKTKSIVLVLLCTLLAACGGSGKEDSEKKDSIASYLEQRATFNTVVDSLSYALGAGYSDTRRDLTRMLPRLGSDPKYFEEYLQGVLDGIKDPKNETYAYEIGLKAGIELRTGVYNEAEAMLFGNDTTQHLNLNNFIAGFIDWMEGNYDFKVDGRLLRQEETGAYVQQLIDSCSVVYMRKTNEKEYQANEAFLQKMKDEPGVKALDNGILYRVIKPGRGPKPSDGNIVSIEFEGALIDSTLITKSHAITDVAVKNGILHFPGFTEMVTNMPVGAEWIGYIPWNLCFGPQGYSDVIPPFSNIVLRVKLYNIKVK